MSLWSVLTRRGLGRLFSGSGRSRLSEEEFSRLRRIALADDPALISQAIGNLSAEEVRELAREVLRERIGEAMSTLRDCDSCRELLSSGGHAPIEMLEEFRLRIGQRGAQMDIDEEGGGGSQRGQGLRTRIRFGPANFLTGLSLSGMTLRESQLQVILHELAHAAGNVIPPDGGNPQESVRNQQRITRACLPETYERISRESESLES
ncbi:MAG TPA: hypothetical protein VGB17_15090 [Pyrinomonadaceae bacterium]|jgi:hypothetical protein